MNSLIEHIKERIRIEDLVAETEPLEGQGRYLRGARHDSLVVDRQEQTYFWNSHICDGWEDRGDILDWVGHRRYGPAWNPRDPTMFRQVLQELADRAGIEMRPLTAEEEQRRRRWREAANLLELATSIYQSCLEQDEEAQAYLRRRGLSAETVQAFRLGSTRGQTTLRDALQRYGAALEAAEEAGLLRNGRDFFQGRRIIIPYLKANRPVYLSSRQIESLPESGGRSPKYLHLPLAGLGLEERPVFNADVLSGSDGPVYLTEGVFCAMSLVQAGYAAAALSGLQLPESLLPRLRERLVILCADNDQAGLGAARTQARRIGYRAYIAIPPRGKDWNEFLTEQRGTPEELASALRQARSLTDILIAEAQAAHGETEKETALHTLFAHIATLPSFARQMAYTRIRKELGIGSREASRLEKAVLKEIGRPKTEEEEGLLIVEGRYPILHPALDFWKDCAITTVGLMTQRSQGLVERLPYLVIVENGRRRLQPLLGTYTLELGGQTAFLREVPRAMGIATWEYPDLERFLQGYTPDPLDVFHLVQGIVDRYIEFQDADTPTVLALYTLGTYWHPLFPAYPYIALNGPKASGKSKTLQLLCFMAFNGLLSSELSDAALFRTIQAYRATLGIDEGERLANPNDPVSRTMQQLLKSGYKAGAPAMRVEKLADGSFVPRNFDLYSPKILANIHGLEDVLESRCLVIRMLRAVTAKGSLPVTSDSEDWAHLRHEIYSLALAFFPQVRSIHRQDSRCRPFNNRYNELWSPLLAIALFLDPTGQRIYEPVLEYARRNIETESGQCLSEWEELLVIALNALTTAGEREVTSGEIIQQMTSFSNPEEGRPLSRQWIGYALKRLGFVEKRRTNEGQVYRIRPAQVADLIRRYGVRLPEARR